MLDQKKSKLLTKVPLSEETSQGKFNFSRLAICWTKKSNLLTKVPLSEETSQGKSHYIILIIKTI